MAAAKDSSRAEPRKIAVIAIHGVADQQPHETARAAAELLLRRGRQSQRVQAAAADRDGTGEDVSFSVDCECGLLLPVEPVRLRSEVRSTRERGLMDQLPEVVRRYQARGELPERPARVEELRGRESEMSEAEKVDATLNHEEMREQLQDYAPAGSDTTYRSVRISLERKRAASVERHVDVYEMYWADLSRLGDRLIGVFLDFYGLLFSLCRLGGASLDRAAALFRHPLWTLSRFQQRVAEALLVLVIPILNLTVLALAAVVVARWAERGSSTLLDLVVDYWFAMVLALLVAVWLYLRREENQAPSWPLRLSIPILLFAALVGVELRFDLFRAVGLAIFLWLIACGLLLVLFRRWERSRGGALRVGALCIVLMTAALVHELFFDRTSSNRTSSKATNAQETFGATVRASAWILGWPKEGTTAPQAKVYGLDGAGQVELLNEAERDCRSILAQVERPRARPGALSLAWLFFFVSVIFATLSGLAALVWGTTTRKPEAKRALWTAHLTLVLPGLVVLVVNISLWQAFVWLASRDFFGTIILGPADHCVVKTLADLATLPNLHWAVAGAGLAGLSALWFILPAAASEGALKRAANTRRPESVRWLGSSLTAAFHWMRAPGELVRVLVAIFLPVVIVLAALATNASPPWSEEHQSRLLQRLPTVIMWLGIVLFLVITGSRGPLRAVALGFRAALDIALDVANWLRLDPRESTPRARICARYVSLLRYVCARGYDGVVVIAHSQGTVITADLLRFLRLEGGGLDPALERLFLPPSTAGDPTLPADQRSLPIHFLSMGCPLRQLYGRRFPFRYGWARPESTVVGAGPRLSSLGVASWSNAYRSGDYVGRNLWRRNNPWELEAFDPDAPSNPNKPDARSMRREECIGLGGHIHYMDDTAPEIGAELDRLIAAI